MPDAPVDPTQAPGVSTGSWLARELDRLSPRRRSALQWWLEHPEAQLVPVSAIVFGAFVVIYGDGDAPAFRASGVDLWTGAGLDVFANQWLQVGPVYLALLGLATLAVEPWAGVVLTGVLLGALQGAVLVWWAMRLARRTARRTGADPVPAAWAIGLVLAVGECVQIALEWGHPEEIAVALLLAEAALLQVSGRPVRGGALLGLAGATKLWAVIGAPVALLGRRPRTIAVCAAAALGVVAVAYLPFLLHGQVRTFEHVWNFDDQTILGWWGFRTGWSEWSLRAVQAGAAVLVGAAVAWRRPLVPELTVLGAVVARVLLDPFRLQYYLSPALVLIVLWAWTSTTPGARRWRLPVAVLAVVVVQARAVLPPDATWWFGCAMVLAGLVLALISERPAQGPAARDLRSSRAR